MFKFVLLIGFGVGLSTFLGSIMAYFIKSISHKTNDIILSFAAGVMLSATVYNLIGGSLDTKNASIFITIAGVLVGAVFILLVDNIVPHLHNYISPGNDSDKLKKVILFLIAIAIHNFPEGLVVGISFSGNDINNAIAMAIGISLQNIPEGLITILPLLAAGVSKKRAFVIALITGMSELLGVIIGYFTINISVLLLPFMLAFAGGTMLYVINHDMITETHSHRFETQATFSLICGFLLMVVINQFF